MEDRSFSIFFYFFEEKTERSDEYTSRRKNYGQRKEDTIL